MSRSSSNGAKGAVFLAFLLLAASPAGAQTPNPPGGSSGGGGTGCTTAGSNGDVLTDNGAGGCNSDGSATLTAGALGLGSSGVLGTLTLGNATSGTIQLEAVAGALGTVTASLPANSGTLAELNLAQSWPAIQTFTTPVLNGTVTGTGVSQAASASTLAQRDASGNVFGNNLLGNTTATVGSGGTTTLTAASSRNQTLNTAAQTYVLPDATTLSLGPWFWFDNNTSGTLTINKNGGSLQYSVPAGGITQCSALDISTAAGQWDCHSYVPASAAWGTGTTGLQMNNVLSTTAQIGAGASSCTAPNFIPQRTAGTTGFGGAGTNVCGAVGGVTTFTSTATAFNIPTGANYLINNAAAATTVNGQSCALAGSCTVTVPISTGVTGLGTGVATFLGTPSSANLRTALTDESGTGAALFANGAIGTATGTSLALGGGAIGSDALEITGTSTFNGASNILAQLNVQNGTISPSGGILIGADSAATTRTDATNKFGYIGGVAYTNANNPIELFGYSATSTANSIVIGGSNSGVTAATDIKLITAASVNTAGNSAVTGLHIDNKQHVGTGGSAPAAGSCGTSPGAPAGNDNAFTIVAGATTGSCTVNFANSYSAAPICIAQDRSTVQALRYAISTSAITIIATAALGGDTLAVICQGN